MSRVISVVIDIVLWIVLVIFIISAIHTGDMLKAIFGAILFMGWSLDNRLEKIQKRGMH